MCLAAGGDVDCFDTNNKKALLDTEFPSLLFFLLTHMMAKHWLTFLDAKRVSPAPGTSLSHSGNVPDPQELRLLPPT